MAFTKEAKPTTSFTKEVKPLTGEMKGKMDIGFFDSAVFDEETGREWDKEAKPITSFTKEAKPL